MSIHAINKYIGSIGFFNNLQELL